MRELLVLLVLGGCGGGEIYLVSDLAETSELPDLKPSLDLKPSPRDFTGYVSPAPDLTVASTPDLWMCLLPKTECAANADCCGNVNGTNQGLHCATASGKPQHVCCMELGGFCTTGIPCCLTFSQAIAWCDPATKKCVTL
jgi:hypothetical protein